MNSLSPKWRLLLHPPAALFWNMAVDEALLREVTAPVLRLYGWSSPAQSLGYFQSWSEALPNLPFVRRYTGGGLVDHRHDFTYSLILPRTHSLMKLGTAESYREIHRGIQAALEKEGIESTFASCEKKGNEIACFEKPVRYDLLIAEKKIAGAAQRRTREGLLQQGSLLLPDPKLKESLLLTLPQTLGEILNFDWEMDELTDEESARAQLLEKERYATKEWNELK